MKALNPPPTQVPILSASFPGEPQTLSHEWATWFSAVARSNEWNEVASFDNSWANTGGAYYNAAYYQDVFGVARLRGRLDSGASGTTPFTLPVNFRPGATMVFSVSGGTVSITSAGVVTLTGTTLDLDNISFIAEA